MSLRRRPEKRTLVRWNDEIDTLLLLTIQWAAADSGIKLPWKKIADQMGPTFTEGAIVQHIAKLRQKLVEDNKQVPPPLRRGTVTSGPSSVYASRRRNGLPFTVKVEDAAGPLPKVASKAKGRSTKRAKNFSDEHSENEPPYNPEDSDEEYSNSKKRKTRASRSQGRKSQKKNPAHNEDVGALATLEADIPKTPTTKAGILAPKIEDGDGPVVRTRGIKVDYKVLGALDEDEYEDELKEERDQADEDDRQYSPRNTANMPVRHVNPQVQTRSSASVYSLPASSTDVVTMPYPAVSPFVNQWNSGLPSPVYSAQTHHRANGFVQSPHSSSFSSTGANSMNSGFTSMDQMQYVQPVALTNQGNNLLGDLNFNFGRIGNCFNRRNSIHASSDEQNEKLETEDQSYDDDIVGEQTYLHSNQVDPTTQFDVHFLGGEADDSQLPITYYENQF